MIKKIILLMGLPGSGKGTQGKILAEKLMLPHVSTGDIFRKMIKTDSEESKLLNEYMVSGKLVPSDLVNKIVRTVLLSGEYEDGCILDGYPRSLKQAEYFMENIDTEISSVFFDVADEVVVKRIMGRYSCQSCGAIYNHYFDTLKVAGVCDYCGSIEVTSRSDDDEKTVLARIEEYKKETLPLVEYYKRKENFFTVNAGGAKEEVMKEISLIAKRI
ncbi:MAG: adenylate kinase [Rickettsiaceae bacterium]